MSQWHAPMKKMVGEMLLLSHSCARPWELSITIPPSNMPTRTTAPASGRYLNYLQYE
jgi:hypothetical protein